MTNMIESESSRLKPLDDERLMRSLGIPDGLEDRGQREGAAVLESVA